MNVQMLTIPEVAERLAVTVPAVRKLIARGDLAACALSPRRTRIPATELEKMVMRKMGMVR